MKTAAHPDARLPVGIFDSGVGGLTVAAALGRRLPGEALLYLGDVARLPYGTKSAEMVTRYSLKAADFLVSQGIKMLIIACNTASAHALEAVARAHPGIPVLGVVEASAAAAAQATRTGRVVVAATEGTCRSGAFARAIAAARPGARVTQIPCPMFVALAEEGLVEGPIPESLVRHYLGEAMSDADCLVLGCTHFPLLVPALRAALGFAPALVDPAEAVAAHAAQVLEERNLLLPSGQGGLTLLATDTPARFGRVAARFLPGLGDNPSVELVNL